MKTLLLADVHGEDPSNLISIYFQTEKIGRVGFVGDVDLPSTLKKIFETTQSINIPIIYSVGNHEFCHVNGLIVPSSLLKESIDYPKLWESFPNERQYILDAIAGKTNNTGLIVRDPDDARVVYTHASLLDIDTRVRDVPDLLETRLTVDYPSEIEANFKEMQQKGLRLFFRGHDHPRALFTRDKNGKTKEKYFPYGKYKLDLENSFSIVTVGAYYRGMHSIYDDETQEIDFRGKGEE